MTRLSAQPELGFQHSFPGRGWVLEITLNGQPVKACVRADDERGFVDVFTDFEHFKRHQCQCIHRIFGDVKIRFTSYLTKAPSRSG